MSAFTSTFMLAFIGFLFLAAILYVTGLAGRRAGCCLVGEEDPENPESCRTCPSRGELKAGGEKK